MSHGGTVPRCDIQFWDYGRRAVTADPHRWARRHGSPLDVALVPKADGRWNVGIRVERGRIDAVTEAVGALDGSAERLEEVIAAADRVLRSFLDALETAYVVVWSPPDTDPLSGVTSIVGRFELDV